MIEIKTKDNGNVGYKNTPDIVRELLPNLFEMTAAQYQDFLEKYAHIVEVAESIPEDFTALEADVADLKTLAAAVLVMIAPEYSAESTYEKGTFVLYEDGLYKAKADIDTAEEWTAAHWDAAVIGSELKALYDLVDLLDADITTLEGSVTDLDEEKADKDGTYPDMTAGNALQLASSTGTENTAPYFFRPVPADATREEVEVVGGSVVWNQYCKKDLSDTETYRKNNATVEYNSSTGVSMVKGTGVNDIQRVALKRPVPSDSNNSILKPNHVYYAYGKVTSHVETSDQNLPTFGFFVMSQAIQNAAGKIANGTTVAKGLIAKAGEGTSSSNQTIFQIRLPNSAPSTDYVDVEDLMLIDLTEALPSAVADYIYTLEQATAGDGVAWYQKYFGSDYKPYSAPTIKSVEGVSAHKLVGFNQWDGEFLRGAYSTTGSFTESDVYISSKNKIPVLPSTPYYFRKTITAPLFICDYDASGTFIRRTEYTNHSGGREFTTSADAHFVNFSFGSSSTPATSADGVCLNISNPTRNGQYEPYVEYTYAMDSSVTLRGIPKIADGEMYFDGDVYKADGTVQRRYALVNMGSLTWVKSGIGFYAGPIADALPGSATHGYNNILTPAYVSVNVASIAGLGNEQISIDSGRFLQVRDDSYSTGDELKAALSDVYCLYQLQTPTTEQATPYTTPQICAPGGTEEFVTTGLVPVGHRTWYPTNQVRKLDGLPEDLGMIAPVEKTTTASQNYAVGSYLMHDNNFYIVTSAIASGETITPGTNVTKTTVAEQLLAIIAALPAESEG